MSIKTSVSVLFFQASVEHTFNFKAMHSHDLKSKPAHWAVFIEYIEDGDAMTASIHQYEFACKPTAKQIRVCKRKAMAEHVSDLAKFKIDYAHCFA